MSLRFKQKAILELFKKKKRVSFGEINRFYANKSQTESTIKTLELLGFIKKTRRMGVWEIL